MALADLNGDGSESSPYEITDIDEFGLISDDLTAHYLVVNDIDASSTDPANGGSGFTPIGSGSGGAFSGSLSGGSEGSESVISGLYVDSNTVGIFNEINGGTVEHIEFSSPDVNEGTNSGSSAGVLTPVMSGAQVTNITISEADLTVISDNTDKAGLVAGDVSDSTTIQDSSVEHSTSSPEIAAGDRIGLVAGLVSSGEVTVDNVHVQGEATSSDATAITGIIGSNEDSTTLEITDCTVDADITGANVVSSIYGDDNYAGNSTITITDCEVNGTSTADGAWVHGGVCGQFYGGDLLIQNCTVNGDVKSGTGYMGGIVGYAQDEASDDVIIIDNCTMDGEIVLDMSDAGESGGIIGYSPPGENGTDRRVSNCTFSGLLTVKDAYADIGGITGYPGKTQFINCVVTGDIVLDGATGVPRIGLFSAYSQYQHVVEDIDIRGTITSKNGAECTSIGGAYGDIDSADVSGIAVECTIDLNSNCSSVGGLVGSFDENDYNSGTANFTDVYAAGEITAGDDVGGLIGTLQRVDVNITNAHAKTQVSGGANVAGDVGNPVKDPVTTDNFYINEGNGDNGYATILTDEEFSNKDNFTGFDFDNVWRETSDYPRLQFQPLNIIQATIAVNNALDEPVEGDDVAIGSEVFTTDANGEFVTELPPGEEVVVTALFGSYQDTYLTDNMDGLVLTYPGLRVTVRHPITDEPLEGIPVQFNDYVYGTDENGEMELVRLPLDEYEINVLDYWEDVAELNDQGAFADILFDGTERTVTVDVDLVDGITGDNVGGVDVLLASSGASNRTADDGTCTVFGEVRGEETLFIASEDPRYQTVAKGLGSEKEEFEFDIALSRRNPMSR